MTERAYGEGQRDQGDQSPDDPGDQRDAAGALDTQPPTRASTGMADQASTPAMLMTRPSRWWLGTICWRRLPEVETCRPYRFRMPQAGYATVDSG